MDVIKQSILSNPGIPTVTQLMAINFCQLSKDEKILLLKKGRPIPQLSLTQSNMSRGKSYLRKFQKKYYDHTKWLCGCEERNAMFCYPCILLGGEPTWANTGFTGLSRFCMSRKRHEESKKHLYNISMLSSMTQILSDKQRWNTVSELKRINFWKLSKSEQLKLKARGRPTPPLTLTQKCSSKGMNYVRKFGKIWYDRKPWMCGCEETTALYCYPCLLVGSEKRTAWTENGVTNLALLSQRSDRHEKSRAHLFSMSKFRSFLNGPTQLQEIEHELTMKQQKLAYTELKRKHFIKKSSTIMVKNLSPMVSNELLKEAFGKFGKVERAVVIVDNKGQSTTRGIVEFKNELCAQNAVHQVQNRCFLITSTPRVISAAMMEQEDYECGLLEQDIIKSSLYFSERTCPPRFAVPGSFEEDICKTWKARYELEQNQRQAFERSMKKSRDIFELEIESIVHDHRSSREKEDSLLLKLGRKLVNNTTTEKPLEGLETNFPAQKTTTAQAEHQHLAPEFVAAHILQQINNSGVRTLTPWNTIEEVDVGTKEANPCKLKRKRKYAQIENSVVVTPNNTLKIALPRLHRNALLGRRKPIQKTVVDQQPIAVLENNIDQLNTEEKNKDVEKMEVTQESSSPRPHKKIQSLVEEHKCDICSDGFPTQDLYDLHMHKHTQQLKLPYSDHFYYTLPPGAKEFRRRTEFKIKTVELSGGEKVKVQIWKVGGRDSQSKEMISYKPETSDNKDENNQVETEILQEISS